MRRINWIDVAKAIGIFAIYVGHISTTDGERCMPFVWTFHVALFFLVSGCAEAVSKKQLAFGEFLVKKLKGLFLPWLVFALIATVVHVFKMGYSALELIKGLKLTALGCVRNNFLPSAGSLWFLTCLFVVQLIFFFIKKLKYQSLILIAAGAVHIVALLLFNVHDPKLPYNLDTAMYYVLYYAIGYVFFEALDKFMSASTLKGKLLLVASGVVAFVYSGLRFFGVDVFSTLYSIPYLGKIISVLGTLIIIYLVLLAAKLMENVELFQKIGQNTLYLCAGEYITHTFVWYMLTLIGISVKVGSTFSGIVYALGLLAFSYTLVMPVLKGIVKWTQSIPDYFVSNKSKEIEN